ncbi:MAG TPA: TolC family protein [Pirellulales bacterium]
MAPMIEPVGSNQLASSRRNAGDAGPPAAPGRASQPLTPAAESLTAAGSLATFVPNAPPAAAPPSSAPADGAAPVATVGFRPSNHELAAHPSRSLANTAGLESGPPFQQAGMPAQLTLAAALETSLEQNPDLLALRETEGVSRAVLGVARAFPFNPFFQFQATPVEQAPAAAKQAEANAAQKIYQYYLVMQTFELAHQRQHRTSIAEAQLRAVRWNVYQAELLNLSQTEQFFFTALYQRGLRELARATADLSGQLLQITERQFAAGHAAASDVATIRMDARSMRQQARLAETNYQTALLALRRQLNLPIDFAFEPVGELAALEWLPINAQTLGRVPALQRAIAQQDNREAIVRELASGRPDVRAAASTMSAAQANVRLAQSSRVPNLIIGPYYQSDDFGIKYFGFRGQVDVPVANTGKPLVRQRRAELRLQQVTARQLRARAEIEVRTAIDRYERARQLAAESALDLGDGLPVEMARLERQFQEGEVDVMRIFTARTSLLQLKRAHLDTLNELALASAVVTAATGLPPDVLIRPAAQPLPPPVPPLPPPAEPIGPGNAVGQ